MTKPSSTRHRRPALTAAAHRIECLEARIAPAAMIFTPSIAGISHAKEEDTADSDLIAGIVAFGLLANLVLTI